MSRRKKRKAVNAISSDKHLEEKKQKSLEENVKEEELQEIDSAVPNSASENTKEEIEEVTSQANFQDSYTEIKKVYEEIENEMLTSSQEEMKVHQEDIKVEETSNATQDNVILKESQALASVSLKKKRYKKYLMYGSCAIVISVVILFCIIACMNKFNTNVYQNVFAFGVNMSGKTSEQVAQILSEISNSMIENKDIDIYQGVDLLFTVKAEEISLKLDIGKTTENIMQFGRTGNVIKDNFDILQTLLQQKEILVTYRYDENALNDIIKNIDLTLKDRMVEDSFSIDEANNKLVIVKGKSGNTIDYLTQKKKLLQAFQIKDEEKVILDVIYQAPTSLDIEEVAKKVNRNPENAYVDKLSIPQKFVAEKVGYEVDKIKLEEFLKQSTSQEEGKTLTFELKVLQPEVKLSDITYTLYQDKLSGQTTYFDAGQKNRATNLKVALSYLNEKIVMPGETFSFGDAIGDITASKGYTNAATFKGTQVVQEIGGGICQTSSTLYIVALKANLEIIERHQHGLPVGYVQPSLDATIYTPVLDLKFKNTRSYPIKISTVFNANGSMSISIFGTKEETEYEISLTSKYISTVGFTTRYIYDNTMPKGSQTIVTNGVNGYVSEGYITKKLNGAVISSSLLSRDTYKAVQQVIKVGTKE